MKGVSETLKQYGGDPESFREFSVDGPDLLPYATLIAARNNGDADLAAVGGVYEWQDRPLLFVIDGTELGDDKQQLNRIRRLVAMRGDAPYLAVALPGSLTVYSIGLQDDISQAQVRIDEHKIDRQIFIPHLGNARPQLASNRRWISDVILKLLTGALDDLTGLKIADSDAISLVGRALFVRFLADRDLLPMSVSNIASGNPSALFDKASTTIAASEWLDKTFNGDFLPLTSSVVKKLPPKAFSVLGSILRRAPGNQLQLGWQEKWDRLDFAHIPVGVLSQAYERYLSHHDPEKQRTEGGYYTPRHVADLMVRASFLALERSSPAHSARVLDPAAGAGVFLLTAFRHLVGARWRKDGHRPDTKTLREILYGQITGFDINESALRFAALGLYLMSIELDPNPEPLKKLRFKNLRPLVLRKFGNSDKGFHSTQNLGSLGDEVGREHRGAYDLVIGNPPWATSTKLAHWSFVQSHVSSIAQERLKDKAAIAPLPNEVLDLPFLWRAMEWARPSGQIAFALHARFLFQRGETMPEARSALFRALDVTGIVNGTELRQTRVWPEITAPFCLLFARNTTPAPGAGFRFTSPHLEGPLNSTGAWRVDAAHAEIVSNTDAQRRPELLKILFRGTRLDLELYDRIALKGLHSLEKYWAERFGTYRGRPKFTGNGYQRLRDSSRIAKGGDGKPGMSAEYLSGLPELSNTQDADLLVNTSLLQKFKSPRVHHGRPRELFSAPLLLVRESPPVQYGRIRTSVALADVIFNQSYHGYSTHTHEHGDELARYLALLVGSKVALWYALITSGRFGFEREVVEKFVIDELPVPKFEDLSDANRQMILALFNLVLQDDDEKAWKKVDAWIGSLFGLTKEDLNTISDTLEYRLPFAANRQKSQAPINKVQHAAFCKRLSVELRPWADRFNRPLTISTIPMPPMSPWQFVLLCGSEKPEQTNRAGTNWMQAIRAADEMSSTEVIYVDDALDRLVLGRLDQARYWSTSQAKLAARRIAWNHIDFLSGQRTK